MYEVLPSFVLGFHGCDAAVAEAVFAGKEMLRKSTNDYDWLGNGVYFWENNPTRALNYAELLRDHPRRSAAARVKDPAVVGAVIDLGRCLNLLDAEALQLVKSGHDALVAAAKEANRQLPRNQRPRQSKELLLRRLDCAVIEFVNQLRNEDQSVEPFDTVRGVFIEGPPIYPNAGFHDGSHIQICVRNPRCIKGYFRVLPEPS